MYTLTNSLTLRFVVDGASMYPQFSSGQFLLVWRSNVAFSEIERGDILVFQLPHDPSRDFLKRVIGLPHEAVEIRASQIYINGQILAEPYIAEACEALHCSDAFWQLGADEYFLLGDNRNHSYDSRSFGAISSDLILGEALIRYWPLHELAWIEKIGLE